MTYINKTSTPNTAELSFNVYSIDGSWLGIHSIESFIELNNKMYDPLDKTFVNSVNEGKTRAALNGDKGYGFLEGFFVSYRKVKIMTKEEQKLFTDSILRQIYCRLKSYFIRCQRYNEDVQQEAILYIYKRMEDARGVNNIENTIKMKYFSLLIDIDRKNIPDYNILDQNGYIVASKTTGKLIFNDFDVMSDDGKISSYIDTYAKDTVGLEDYNESCISQVNELKMAEIIKDVLYDRFPEKDVLMYLDYIENFRNVRVSNSNGGVTGLGLKYGISRTTVKNKTRDFKEYLQSKKEEITELYEAVCYPNLDSLSLRNIISD